MSAFEDLLRLREENERAQQGILYQVLRNFERNYERAKFGKITNFLDPGFNRHLRQNTDRHAGGAIERTRQALRKSSRELAAWSGLTEEQRIELGRYFIGTEFEGNVYLEEKC